MIRFSAEQRGRKRPEETSALASTALGLYFVIFVVAVAITLALAGALPSVVDIPDRYVDEAQLALILVLLGFAFRFPLGLFTSLLAGQQRYDVINFAGLLSAVLYLVGRRGRPALAGRRRRHARRRDADRHARPAAVAAAVGSPRAADAAPPAVARDARPGARAALVQRAATS